MSFKSSSQELYFYKHRILYFLINNSGKYTLQDLSQMFGFNKRRLQDFLFEYNKNGFNVFIKKGLIYVGTMPRAFTEFNKLILYQNLQKLLIYQQIANNPSGISRKELFNYMERNIGLKISNTAFHNLISSLMNDVRVEYDRDRGILYCENMNFNNIMPEKALELLIFLSVAKNILPRGKIVEEIYDKLKFKFKKLIDDFREDVIITTNRKRLSTFDEIILKLVEEAIKEEKGLKIKYRTRRGNKIQIINPAGVIYLENKDMWYLVENVDKIRIYRFDKIIDVEVIEGHLSDFDKDNFLYSFGISNERLVDIKIKFEKEDFIYRKLLKYNNIRKCSNIFEKDDCYILIDKINGILEVKKWIRGFGRSAYVIEPKELRDDIINDLDMMMIRYGDICE